MRTSYRQGDQFPTISVLVTADDTVGGQRWRGVLPLLGMTFDQRTTQNAYISAVIAAAFGGDALPGGVHCNLLADTSAADYASGFDARQTPLGAISFELAFDADFAGMADVPLIFTVAGVATDAPADADITLPSIAGNTTSITLKDFQGGALPNGFYSEAVEGSVTEVTGTAPIQSSGGTAPVISIDPATGTDPGSMSAADKTKLDAIDMSTKADLVSGKVPADQLPSYVDDVLEYANLAAFPATGETGKIYIAIDTNKGYRWTGSVYSQINTDDLSAYAALASANNFTAIQKMLGLKFATAASLTIATGAVTVTQGAHTIDTEGSASTDDLDTLNGLAAGMFYVINAANAARTVVVKHGTGNIYTFGGADLTLDDVTKVLLVYSPDGTNALVFGDGGSSGGGTADGSGQLTKSVAGGTDVTLTAAESQNGNLSFTGLLTANINVVLYDTTERMYRVYNNTTGSFTLTLKTSAGTGIAITQGGSALVECDGTNVVEISTGGTPGADGAGYGGTSTSSNSIGTGTKTFTTQSGLAYTTASRVRAASDADNANWLEGNVTSYSGTTLVIDSDKVGGSGTKTDWSFSIIGEPGADGTGGGGSVTLNAQTTMFTQVFS